MTMLPCHPECSEGSVALGHRDASLRLSMTACSRLLLPPVVTLSAAKGLSMVLEMLCGVYPERSECAQHDRAVTHTAAWINVFMCIIVLTTDSSAQRRLSTPT